MRRITTRYVRPIRSDVVIVCGDVDSLYCRVTRLDRGIGRRRTLDEHRVIRWLHRVGRRHWSMGEYVLRWTGQSVVPNWVWGKTCVSQSVVSSRTHLKIALSHGSRLPAGTQSRKDVVVFVKNQVGSVVPAFVRYASFPRHSNL